LETLIVIWEHRKIQLAVWMVNSHMHSVALSQFIGLPYLMV